MKITIRKVLSLLMAFAILWGALPTAAAQGTAPVTVTLSAPKTEITVGETVTLTASVTGPGASEDAVRWYYEENPSPVCRASEHGNALTLTGIAEGTVTVVATYRDDANIYAEAVIHIEPAPVIPVTGLDLTPSAATLPVGAEMTLSAALTPENATNREILWATSDADVASVDSAGRVRANRAGTAVITATANDGGYSDSCAVTVPAGEVRSVTLSDTSLTLIKGGSQRLIAVTDPADAAVEWRSSNPEIAAVSSDGYVTAREAGRAVITARAGGREAVCAVVVTGGMTIGRDSVSLALGGSVVLEAAVDMEGVPGSNIIWSSSDPSVAYIYRRDNTGSATTVYAGEKGTAVITAALEYAGGIYADTCLVEVGGGIGAEATVYRSSGGCALGDGDGAGGVSVTEQIADEIGSLTGWSEELDYVVFQAPLSVSRKGFLDARPSRNYYFRSDSSGDLLDDVIFTPDEDFTGDVSFPFTAVDTGRGRYSGAITFHVEDGFQDAGILYAARTGENVALNADDFVDFWDEQYPGGKLEYVIFSSVSRGGLYGAGGSQKWTDVEVGGVKCYLVPGGREIGLEELTYVPTRDTASAVIRFTAYGVPRGAAGQTGRSGSITILYTDEDVAPITYRTSALNAATSLRAADFMSVYQSAVNAAGADVLTIRFLSVPQSGALYWDRAADRDGRVTGVKLTEANIGGFFFTAGGTAGRRIEEVSYVPGSPGAKDTASYACYADGALQFIGSLIFDGTSAAEDLTVNYISRGGPVSFAPSDFCTGGARYASYVIFGAPTDGRLTSGGMDAAAGRFSLSGAAGYQGLGSVVYAPSAGYTGAVQIPFCAYDSLDRPLAAGTVNIFVTPPVVSFTDIPAGAWYYAYVSSLAGAGILSGYGDNTFRPDGKLTWGEALKLIMMAVGYSDLSIANGGGAWAEGFLIRAQADGLVSGGVDLNSHITREAFAAVAARALKLPAAAPSPFTDTGSGYAAALYNTFVNGQRIISGDGDGRFRPNDAIKRSEVCKIICLMRDYRP